MGRNQNGNPLVRAGKLCYNCEEQEPLPGLDEFGGHSCQKCRKALLAMRYLYAVNPDRATEGKARKCKLKGGDQ